MGRPWDYFGPGRGLSNQRFFGHQGKLTRIEASVCYASVSRDPLRQTMVVDTRYYDILQVQPDADELAIKKVLSLHFPFLEPFSNSCHRLTNARPYWYLFAGFPVHDLCVSSIILTRILILQDPQRPRSSLGSFRRHGPKHHVILWLDRRGVPSP